MEVRINELEQIPESIGSYLIRSNGGALYADFSANMRSSIAFLLNVDRDGLQDIRNSQNTIVWKKAASLFDAMADVRELAQKERPELNQQVRLSDDYTYLAIDFINAPFFRMETFTTGDLFYVGPFRNRFKLTDTLYTMGELLGTPVCDEPNQPCSRLKSKKCIGWCLKKDDQSAMLMKRFLIPDFGWLDELRQKADRLMDDLDFEKADILTKQIRLIESFFDNIRFLHCTKQIEGTVLLGDRECRIRYGLLQSIRKDGVEHIFQSDTPMQYRENEKMAVDKTQYDERRAIYLWFLRNEPEKIGQWMDRGIEFIREKPKEAIS